MIELQKKKWRNITDLYKIFKTTNCLGFIAKLRHFIPQDPLFRIMHGVRWTLCVCLFPSNAHNPNLTPSVNSPKKHQFSNCHPRHHWSALSWNYFDMFHRSFTSRPLSRVQNFPYTNTSRFSHLLKFCRCGIFHHPCW